MGETFKTSCQPSSNTLASIFHDSAGGVNFSISRGSGFYISWLSIVLCRMFLRVFLKYKAAFEVRGYRR